MTTWDDAPRHRGRSRAGRGVLAVLVGALLLVLVAGGVAFAVVPRVLGGESLVVLSGSMQPAIAPGDLIAIREVPFESIGAGDVVTYQARSGDPTLVTHRVVGVGRDPDGDRFLVLQGDANDATDDPVVEAQTRGVFLYRLPVAGYVVAALGPVLPAVVGVGLIVLGAAGLLPPRRRQSSTRTSARVVSASA